jgi:hypothetical protein
MELAADGHEVVVLTRDRTAVRGAFPPNVTTAEWDAEARRLSPEVLADAHAVVHLAGTGVADKRWSPERRRSILESRVGGGEAISRAIESLDPPRRPQIVISGSAVGLYGDRGDEILTESSTRGDGFLADVCERWEQSVASDVARTVNLRIGVVLAPSGGALERMLPPFQMGAGGRLGNGRQWMSWIHIDDLTSLIRFAIEHDEVSGPINAVSPGAVTNREFTRVLARTLGRPAIMPVPSIALRLALGEMASMLLGGQRVDAGGAREAGFVWKYPDLASALAQTCSNRTKEIYRAQWVASDIDTVFSFFSDAYNLEKITPDFMGFRVLGLEPDHMGNGTTIRYRLRLRGLRMRWKSRIDSWDPPRSFVDSQIRGPYALWHHSHEFTPHEGGTLVVDRVRYRLPLGTLGDLVAGSTVGRDLKRIFAYRYEVVEALFGAPPGF